MRPFEGIRVLDFTRVVSGPYCTHQLGLLGAEIIKIEDRDGGDSVRQGVGDPLLSQEGLAATFVMLNAGKKSVTLDLKKAQARHIVLSLVATADVVVENFRPGVIDRLGLGYEVLSARNPQIIFCSISGFGQSGPDSRAPAFDPNIQAMSGMMALTGEPDGPPLRAGYTVADTGTGLQAALAISAALYQRKVTGLGQRIDVAMLDSAMSLLSQNAAAWLNAGVTQKRRGNLPINPEPASGTFETADGTIMLVVIRNDHFKLFARSVGLDSLADDARCATRDARAANYDDIRQRVAAEMVKATTAQWKKRLDEAGVPCSPVLELAEALDQPQTRHRNFVVELTDEETGKPMRMFSSAFKYAHGTPRPGFAPARLGAHTRSVLVELGVSEAELEELARQKVI